MSRVKGAMVMAVLAAVARAREEARDMPGERISTSWTLRMARLRRIGA